MVSTNVLLESATSFGIATRAAITQLHVFLNSIARGRNPELSITTVDGEVINGGFVIFDVMKSMNPDFAVFQVRALPRFQMSRILLNIPFPFSFLLFDVMHYTGRHDLC